MSAQPGSSRSQRAPPVTIAANETIARTRSFTVASCPRPSAGVGGTATVTPRFTPPDEWIPRTGDGRIPAMTRTTTATEAPLTDRQREVVALIAAGCSNDEVGRSLGISSRTAKAHSDALRMKLGVARRRQIPAAFRLLTGEDPYVPALVRLRPPRSR